MLSAAAAIAAVIKVQLRRSCAAGNDSGCAERLATAFKASAQTADNTRTLRWQRRRRLLYAASVTVVLPAINVVIVAAADAAIVVVVVVVVVVAAAVAVCVCDVFS